MSEGEREREREKGREENTKMERKNTYSLSSSSTEQIKTSPAAFVSFTEISTVILALSSIVLLRHSSPAAPSMILKGGACTLTTPSGERRPVCEVYVTHFKFGSLQIPFISIALI